MRRMTHVRRAERRLGDAPDGKDAAPARELARERQTGFDLGARRRAVRDSGAGMRRHDVPKEDCLLEPELVENTMHDRRRRLAGSRAGQLTLGCERDARDARAAVAGSLPDEQHRRIGAVREVTVETVGEPLVSVLVERLADPGGRDPVYQRSQWTTSSSPRRRCVKRLVARLAFGSGRALPTVTPATTCTSSGIPSNCLNAARSGTVTP